MQPTILVFDSGFGGLSVLGEVQKLLPGARYVYAADSAAFPYGHLSEAEVRARVLAVFERLMGAVSPSLVVLACNTASTSVLVDLRGRFAVPFVGTVPAIKPAVQASKTKLITVLGTPGTVAREYTRDLIAQFAQGCEVTLVGAKDLAGIAEAKLKNEPISDADISAEIRPCFVEYMGSRTDHIVLACTHYPFLLPELQKLALWPVRFIDPALAIARRVTALLGEAGGPGEAPRKGEALFTGPTPLALPVLRMLATYGLDAYSTLNMPLNKSLTPDANRAF